MEKVNWGDFEKIELRVGMIVEVLDFPEAKKPSYKLKIDFSEFGILKSGARITNLYTKEELIGKQIIGVINFPIKKIGPFELEVLTTGFYRENGDVVLAVPDKLVPNGSKIG